MAWRGEGQKGIIWDGVLRAAQFTYLDGSPVGVSISGTNGKMVKFTGTSTIGDATNTDTDVADAVSKKHTQNTDTALASGAIMAGYCFAADHGAAASAMLVNVCYGTGAAPTASTTTEGSLYITYTA